MASLPIILGYGLCAAYSLKYAGGTSRVLLESLQKLDLRYASTAFDLQHVFRCQRPSSSPGIGTISSELVWASESQHEILGKIYDRLQQQA
jgi:hypothetical protein